MWSTGADRGRGAKAPCRRQGLEQRVDGEGDFLVLALKHHAPRALGDRRATLPYLTPVLQELRVHSMVGSAW